MVITFLQQFLDEFLLLVCFLLNNLFITYIYIFKKVVCILGVFTTSLITVSLEKEIDLTILENRSRLVILRFQLRKFFREQAEIICANLVLY